MYVTVALAGSVERNCKTEAERDRQLRERVREPVEAMLYASTRPRLVLRIAVLRLASELGSGHAPSVRTLTSAAPANMRSSYGY